MAILPGIKQQFLSHLRMLVICAVLVASISGCSAKVNDDYGRYLANNTGTFKVGFKLPSTCYYLPYPTQNHYFSFRSFTGGYYLKEWDVEIGKALDATMLSRDVADIFENITKSKSRSCDDGNIVTIDLNKYNFSNCQASVDVTITLSRTIGSVTSNRYTAVGQRQCGKMYWGGAFATKNAVQQSTKDAIDKILFVFLSDYRHSLDEIVATNSNQQLGVVVPEMQ